MGGDQYPTMRDFDETIDSYDNVDWRPKLEPGKISSGRELGFNVAQNLSSKEARQTLNVMPTGVD